MEKAREDFFSNEHWTLLTLEIVGLLAMLGKAADWLVSEAVVLSERSGMPKVIIGATVVSLGTTTPEAAVSVLSALQGEPRIALGNAVGSIICDTALIPGIAMLIAAPKRCGKSTSTVASATKAVLRIGCTRPRSCHHWRARLAFVRWKSMVI